LIVIFISVFIFILVLPQVNQVEMHPLFPQAALRRLCAARGVLLQSYAPLGSREGRARLAAHSAVARAAGAAGAAPEAALLAWAAARADAVVVGSTDERHLEANLRAARLESLPRPAPRQREGEKRWVIWGAA